MQQMGVKKHRTLYFILMCSRISTTLLQLLSLRLGVGSRCENQDSVLVSSMHVSKRARFEPYLQKRAVGFIN